MVDSYERQRALAQEERWLGQVATRMEAVDWCERQRKFRKMVDYWWFFSMKRINFD